MLFTIFLLFMIFYYKYHDKCKFQNNNFFKQLKYNCCWNEEKNNYGELEYPERVSIKYYEYLCCINK